MVEASPRRSFAASPAASSSSASSSPDETTHHAFQAETRRLLDIVTNSLYTDKEVFVRELVSNASDALEKRRHDALTSGGGDPGEEALAIKIAVDEARGVFVVEDNGAGMSESELRENLGTIARSGSKAFVEGLTSGEAANAAEAAEASSEAASKAPESSTATPPSASPAAASNIIGKFGVGFYAAFMVADRVDVFSSVGDGVGRRWSSAGDGSFSISPCEVDDDERASEDAEGGASGSKGGASGAFDRAPRRGTRIVLRVKDSDKPIAASAWAVETTLKKYSAFVGFPVYLNGRRMNDVDALWFKTRESEVSDEDATAFYRFVSGANDAPAFRMHFGADAPLTIRALLFAPGENPERGFGARALAEDQSGVSLYSRRVLIQQNARALLPPFLRFVRGVVDCEDVPLNISRENWQDSDLVRRLGDVVARRFVKFLGEKAKREPEKYEEWYGKLGVFLKEGVCGDQSYAYKDALVPLLRFETSRAPDEEEEEEEGKEEEEKDGDAKEEDDTKGDSKKRRRGRKKRALASLDEYVARMPEGQREIYYLVATGGRAQAERSPYLEAMRAKGYEVLFLYAHVDEFVMQHARKHKGFDLVSAEAADVDAWEEDADEKDASSKDEDASSKDASLSKDASNGFSNASNASSSAATLTSEEMSALCDWFATSALAGKVESVRPSTRLRASPALLTGHEPEAMRRYRAMLTMMADDRTAKKLDDLRNAATLELNPRHAIVRGIERLRGSEDESERRLATLAAEQVFDNARASAGAMDDPREMVGRVHEILERALEREGTANAS